MSVFRIIEDTDECLPIASLGDHEDKPADMEKEVSEKRKRDCECAEVRETYPWLVHSAHVLNNLRSRTTRRHVNRAGFR